MLEVSSSNYTILLLIRGYLIALTTPAPDITIFDIVDGLGPEATVTTRTVQGISAVEVGSTNDETTYVVNGVWTTTFTAATLTVTVPREFGLLSNC